MMATLLSPASYLLNIACITALPYLVFRGAMSVFSVPKKLDGFVATIAIFLTLALKNFPVLTLISEFPSTLPSSVFEMIATLLCLCGYLLCMTGLSFVVLVIAILVCEATLLPHSAKESPDWLDMIEIGVTAVLMDLFMKHSSYSNTIAMILFLAGYLIYILCMTSLPYLVFRCAMSAFSVPKDLDGFVATMAIFLALALKNFSWLALMSKFPSTLPSSIFEMIATLLGLCGYLLCMTGLSFVVLVIAILVCEATLLPHSAKGSPDWLDMIEIGVAAVLMDMFMKHSSHSSMMAMILLLPGQLFYIMCMPVLSYLVFRCAMSAIPVLKKFDMFVASFIIFLLLALKNFWWLAMFPEFPSTSSSSISEMIATLLGLCGYLLCMTSLSFLVLIIAILVCEAALWHDPEKESPEWIDMIDFSVTVLVMDLFMKHSSHSNMMDTLLFAGYLIYIMCMMGLIYLAFENLVFDNTILPVLPFLQPIALKYRNLATVIVAWVILVLNDMHGLAPVKKPAFISEFLSSLPFNVSNTLSGYIIHIVCMVALSFVVLITATGAICRIRIQWPMERPQLVLTTIVGLTFMLLNMMWGTPFERPSFDTDMKASLVGLTGYLIYILCSMAVSDMLSKSTMEAFVISLTFVLLDMFGISDVTTALFGLAWVIATSVMALFALVALSFAVCMGLHTWVSMLVPSAVNNYSELMFAIIVGLSFKVMKTMLDIPVVEKFSILSNMKAALLGIADLRKDHHVAYLVIRYLTVLALPCLLMESRYMTSTCKLHTRTAIIIALGLVLTMAPSTPMPIKDLAVLTMALDDIVGRTVKSFITHTILILVTLVGGIVLYVRDQYPLWKATITGRYREFKEDAGREAKSYVNHLVYKCTLGCFGKKKANASKRWADQRARRR